MDVPQTQTIEEDLEDYIGYIHNILRENHDEDYCGIVYVDNPDEPTLIKVFGPKNLGASCRGSGSKTWPRWIISHMSPTELGVKLDHKGNQLGGNLLVSKGSPYLLRHIVPMSYDVL